MFSWIRHCVAEVCALPSALLVQIKSFIILLRRTEEGRGGGHTGRRLTLPHFKPLSHLDDFASQLIVEESNESCEEMFHKGKTHLEPLEPQFMKDPKPRWRLHRMHKKQQHVNRLTFKPNKAEFDPSSFGHILEIYDFSPEMTTGDFKEAFSSFQKSGFDIKWVDGWHVLAIFSSANAANEALALPQAKLRIRPLSRGSKQSRHEFQVHKQFLRPVKPRLPRDMFVAYRLVMGALGLLRNSKKKEREMYRIAR
uniref:Uncharacterized protein n=1 Tax=Eptatretus burgeri TaxID=7764 RepID=A0A8C4QIZ1_EPTBU